MIPKVSIIIPVYNVDRYLKECLDSLISQTLVDIEIICINDSSTDNSLSILNEYAQKDNRVKVCNNSENQGLSCTRNVGLGVAIGEYIGFVDSDDYVDKDFFEKLYISASSNDADATKLVNGENSISSISSVSSADDATCQSAVADGHHNHCPSEHARIQASPTDGLPASARRPHPNSLSIRSTYRWSASFRLHRTSRSSPSLPSPLWLS